ncbi:MAG: DUF6708 domain-containing protein [Achromobacter mucicolens]
MADTKRLPRSLRFGGTPLYHHQPPGEHPQPDGVRRVNERCVELETYANFTQSGAARHIGLGAVVAIAGVILMIAILNEKNSNFENYLSIIMAAPALPAITTLIYFASGAHRTRGAYVRINRRTQKLYYVFPRSKRLHVIDWAHVEALAGYIPIFSGTINTSRHPLYLLGVDLAMTPPTEKRVSCGNLGVADGVRAAKALWAYLQAFMAHGPEGLPEPAPLPPRLTRKQEALQPYREWYAGLRRRIAQPYGLMKAPITIPLSLCGLLIHAIPDSVEAFVQYNVPYAQFPAEIDRLCGFEDPRTQDICVNSEQIEP